MARARATLTIYQGEDFRFEVLWEDDAGEPIDLSAYTAVAQVRKTYKATATILKFDSAEEEGAGDIELTAKGLVVLTADNAMTAAIKTGLPGVWDLEVTSPGGIVTRLAAGPARLSLETTR